MKSFAFLLALAGVLLATAAANAQPAVAAGRVPLALALKLREPAALDALIDAQSDPRSPQYAHFLTPAQFRAAFAPTADTYAATVAQLKRAGFRIEREWENRTLIEVSAPPTLVTRTFGAPLVRTLSRAGSRYVAQGSLRVPAALGVIAAVVGASANVAATSAGAMREVSRPPSIGSLGVGPDGGFSPNRLAAAYDFPVLHGFDGRGVKVADTIDDPDSDANVDTFLTNFGIKRRVPQSVIIGFGSGEDTVQPDLDAEWTLGLAPGATYYAYVTTFLLDQYILTMFTKLVSDNIVDVVNTSFASCELDDSFAIAIHPLLAQGAAQGIAFEGVQFGAPSTCDVAGIDPIEYPGGDNNSLAVGGANAIVDPNGHIVAQSALPATGGGVSLIEPTPKFQQGIPGVASSGRNTPDLVVGAELNSTGPSGFFVEPAQDGPPPPPAWNGGYPFVNNAPAAGMLAEIQQMVHHRLGAFDRTLYRVFRSHGYGPVFTDITAGCDGLDGPAPLCARAGYDVTSGIGTVDVYRLAELLR